jgi:7-cyano-7-deazaguanine synthase in queuosine biosynthesis
MSERLILCGDVKRPSGTSPISLCTSGRSQNIVLKLEDIGKKMIRRVPDALIDLIEIATYVYCADRAVSRGGVAQRAVGADWRRSFRFIIPVRTPDHWSNRDVLEPLRSTLSFLSEDDYEFEFEKATNPAALQDYLKLGDDNESDEVVPFSGGLDSLSGTIEELSSGKRVALVSHRSSPKIFDHQKRLVAELKRRFPKRVMHVPVLVTRQETLPAREYTQRSRSFLYAALACVVARLLGNTRIRFFENGVISINLPISSQLVGARDTRTTHPLVLEHFRRFFSAATHEAIEFDNPFIWKTKADVVKSIVSRNCGELIKYTVSCTRVHEMTRLHSHCGCCSQCIDRRFAVLATNAAEYDPAEKYKVELLAGQRDKAQDKTMAESYVRTALELRELDEIAFFSRFAGETARVLPSFRQLSADEVGRRVLDLHQRHAQDIWNVLKGAVERHSAELVNRSLAPSSLLMMTVGRGEAPAFTPIRLQPNPLKTWLHELESEIDESRAYAPQSDAALAKESSSPVLGKVPKRGPRAIKFEQVKEIMERDIREGRQTADNLRAMREKNLAATYGVSRDTARKARRAVLSEFVDD